MAPIDWIRLAAALSALTLIGAAQWRWRRDPLPEHRAVIAASNLALGVLGVIAVRLMVPWVAVDAALWSQQHGFGLLHAWPLPRIATTIAGVLLLDLALYLQHVVMHRVNWLWRLHAVHHGDKLLDVTTGYRFHPLEIVVSMLWKLAVAALAGIDPWVVVAFEIWLNTMSIYTHANLRLPLRWESALSALFVTPDFHRVHHSVIAAEQHSNFGFDLTVWDRLFGTLQRQSRLGPSGRMGLHQDQRHGDLGVLKLLQQPFFGSNSL